MAPLSPGRDCSLCPRLVRFRAAARAEHPDWHNAPVASFGGLDARLLIVGLAPGLRGANRTGRPFTGDFAGGLLYRALGEFGFATGRYDARADDGLRTIDCRITNAVRCVPPANKPTAAETAANFERNLALLTQIEALAEEKGATLAQLAIAWVMAQGSDIIPIPGAKSRAHLEENVKAIDLRLTPDELARLDAVMPPGAAAGTRAAEAQLSRLNI